MTLAAKDDKITILWMQIDDCDVGMKALRRYRLELEKKLHDLQKEEELKERTK